MTKPNSTWYFWFSKTCRCSAQFEIDAEFNRDEEDDNGYVCCNDKWDDFIEHCLEIDRIVCGPCLDEQCTDESHENISDEVEELMLWDASRVQEQELYVAYFTFVKRLPHL